MIELRDHTGLGEGRGFLEMIVLEEVGCWWCVWFKKIFLDALMFPLKNAQLVAFSCMRNDKRLGNTCESYNLSLAHFVVFSLRL